MIISDTHNFKFGDAEEFHGKFRHPTPKSDVLLHCGDLTGTGTLEQYRGALEMLGKIDAELKLVIAGNHDLSLDKKWWAENEEDSDSPDEPDNFVHAKAVEMWTGDMAKKAGVTYLEEGLNTFTLRSGAKFTIYTSPYQPEFCNWAFAYNSFEDRFNPPDKVNTEHGFKCIAENPIPDFPGVDIVMTHGPPKDILDWTAHGTVGCHNLIRAVSRARPLLYCFGHIHEAHGAKVVKWKDDRNEMGSEAVESEADVQNSYPENSKFSVKLGRETLMVNAAVMNVHYRPTNPPWLIDLDLPNTDSG